jgi:hypothetical protein
LFSWNFLFHFLCHCLFSSKHLLIMKFFATFHDFKLVKTKRFKPTWVFWRSMKSSWVDWVCFWMTHFSWRSLQNKCVKFFIIELNAYYSTPHGNPNMWISKLFVVDFFFCFVNLSWTMQRWSHLTPFEPPFAMNHVHPINQRYYRCNFGNNLCPIDYKYSLNKLGGNNKNWNISHYSC